MKISILLFQAYLLNFFSTNWKYLLGLILSFIGIIIAYKNYKKETPEKKEEIKNINNNSNNSSNFSNTSNVPVSIINNNFISRERNKIENSLFKSDENMKATTKILFIDDNHTDYKIVSILKKAGWAKTKSVKDITDLDCSFVSEADVIFVDINGVGLELFEDQGLGLASALKKKYPNKKIVIYSAETTGDRFHQALREVDFCLPKNADAYQFINLIEILLKENG